MYAATVILFLIPTSLILIAWMRARRRWDANRFLGWRERCVIAGMVVGSCAILAGLLKNLLWWRAGGDPHGLGTPYGIWAPLYRVFFFALLLSGSLAVLGKGKGRLVTLAALVVAFASDTVVYLLNMQ